VAAVEKLSEQLDFEGVGPDGREFAENPAGNTAAGNDAADAEADKDEPRRRGRRRQITTAPSVTNPEVVMPRSQINRNSADNYRRKDEFARYAASVALVGLLVFGLGIYSYTQMAPKNEAALSYFALPQTVINVDGQVARLQATIQVDADDEDWLQDNKKVIGEIFQIEVSKVNPLDLRTPEGFESMQKQLKQQINAQMKVDKVQAVLLTELLTQTRG
jgi:flagellar basal body-associated protein FliL